MKEQKDVSIMKSQYYKNKQNLHMKIISLHSQQASNYQNNTLLDILNSDKRKVRYVNKYPIDDYIDIYWLNNCPDYLSIQ